MCALAAAACTRGRATTDDAGAPPSPAVSAAPAPTGAPSVPRPVPIASSRGSTIALAPSGDILYAADEGSPRLFVVLLPLSAGAPPRAVPLPGVPAQIVALDDRVLVTIRDPGLLLVLRPDPAAGLAEVARVALPADAWGLAVTPDGATAIVSSAWTHQVSAVDLRAATKRWSVDVAREPRGVAVRPDGAAAYVTHLVGASLTRIDGLAAAAPTVRRIDLPASPLRTPSGRALHASLGYAAALSDDGARLYAARHAVGAMGREAWFGAATVDVLLTDTDTPLAPKHAGRLPFLRADHGAQADEIKLPGGALAPFTQPRAVVYRRRTQTVLVAGEGDDLVAELDAISADPTLAVVRTYKVGAGYAPEKGGPPDTGLPYARSGGAPSGIALSEDESVAWVLCRSSGDIAEITLDPPAPGAAPAPRYVSLAPGGREDATLRAGRGLFYSATDRIASGGLACSGCHPEGRDDGAVWHEAKFNTADGTGVNFVGASEDVPDEDHTKGVPRRTPIIAGRVAARGPYGWHAESPTLDDRIARGFSLHRWGAEPAHEPAAVTARAACLAEFLRRELPPPPREARDLTEEEARGRTIFLSDAARCSRCHVPETGYSDRIAYPLPKLPKLDDFDDEAEAGFKTPSLLFVGGHAPYFHDGSASSLEALIEKNADRMGTTSHLSREDRAALAAYLRTL